MGGAGARTEDPMSWVLCSSLTAESGSQKTVPSQRRAPSGSEEARKQKPEINQALSRRDVPGLSMALWWPLWQSHIFADALESPRIQDPEWGRGE